MSVVTYCYYEKVRRTMRTAIVSYLLNSNNFHFFIPGKYRPKNSSDIFKNYFELKSGTKIWNIIKKWSQ